MALSNTNSYLGVVDGQGRGGGLEGREDFRGGGSGGNTTEDYPEWKEGFRSCRYAGGFGNLCVCCDMSNMARIYLLFPITSG